jgi:mannose-1-phosphate guanylyltransferase
MIHTKGERRVVIQGLDGYIVAEKNDTLLICKLSEEQRIKEFSAEKKRLIWNMMPGKTKHRP